jgi:hypothetical protein
LHYQGIDIETTNGTLVDYSKQRDAALLPIEEIVSINLLDTSDAYLAAHEVGAEDMLQASRLAFILSHDREVVAHNLDAAYGKLINSLMDKNNYNQAMKVAKASRNQELLGVVGHNGAVYEMRHHNYAAARRYAAASPQRDELVHSSWQAEGAYQYQEKHYHEAIKAFKRLGDQKLVGQCYQALYVEEQRKLGANLTTDSIKHHSRTIKRMRLYAKRSGNKKLVSHANNLYKYL